MSRENRTEFIIKVFYVIIASVSLFKFRTASLTSGLDVSWVYAINRFFHEGVLWGHDVMFTYGPFGFVLCPMNIGSNALISLAYWVFIALSAGLLFSYTLFSKRFSLNDNNILLSLVLFYLGNCVLGRLSGESVSTFIILLLLSLCVRSGEFKFFIMASLLCVLSMFMKFNSGAVNFIMLVIFALLFNPAKYIPALLITPALFFIYFMAYNPSLSELAYYIRGAYEISSGYISAMSTSFFLSKSFAGMMTLMLLVYAAVLFVILIKSEVFRIKHSLRYVMIFAMPLFGLFRHAFTRSGEGHNFEFMPVLYIWLSLYVLFMESRINIRQKFSKFLKYSLCLIFCASFLLSSLGINKLGI